MIIIYTTRDIEADFSSIIERVREGEIVAIAHKGEVVAEIRPVERRKYTIEDRMDDLERRGVLVRSGERERWQPPDTTGAPAPGALARFLEERGSSMVDLDSFLAKRAPNRDGGLTERGSE